jgi:hypothetical protein
MYTHTLNFDTDQSVCAECLMSETEICFMFDDHFQIWNLETGERIFRGAQYLEIDFYSNPVSISRTTVAVFYLS